MVREQSFWAVSVYRFGQWTDTRDTAIVRILTSRVYWAAYRVIETVTGITMDKSTQIGPGLRIHHFGGIVIHPGVIIGKNCTLRHGVTIGERRTGAGVPRLGDDVEVGANAMILGPIEVADEARIGAGALVLESVPRGGVAVAPRATISTAADSADLRAPRD